MNREIETAKEIIQQEIPEEADRFLKEMEDEFIEEDYQSLAKLNSMYERGYLTRQEFVDRIGYILAAKWIEKRNRG